MRLWRLQHSGPKLVSHNPILPCRNLPHGLELQAVWPVQHDGSGGARRGVVGRLVGITVDPSRRASCPQRLLGCQRDAGAPAHAWVGGPVGWRGCRRRQLGGSGSGGGGALQLALTAAAYCSRVLTCVSVPLLEAAQAPAAENEVVAGAQVGCSGKRVACEGFHKTDVRSAQLQLGLAPCKSDVARMLSPSLVFEPPAAVDHTIETSNDQQTHRQSVRAR